MRLPPQEYLTECFDYDPETGALTWKMRPRRHFTSEGQWKSWNTRFKGSPALHHIRNDGYRSGHLTVDGVRRVFLQHLVIWKLVKGEDPVVDVDHQNTNRSENQWDNLRLGSRSSNLANSSKRHNKTGFKGVAPNGKRWAAKITHQGCQIHLGTFDTPELASAAYAQKAKDLYGEFARIA